MLHQVLKLPLRPFHGFASQLLARGGVRDSYFQDDYPEFINVRCLLVFSSVTVSLIIKIIMNTGIYRPAHQKQD